MASAPGAVLVLVCPTCGKKYRGNPEKPDGRYQCPDDQATLTKFTPPGAVAPPAPKSAEPIPPPPDFSVNGQTEKQETSEKQRGTLPPLISIKTAKPKSRKHRSHSATSPLPPVLTLLFPGT